MEPQNIYQICQKSARHDTGITFHSRTPERLPERISYRELLTRAHQDVSKIEGIKPDRIVILYFDGHQDNIRWFCKYIF